MYLGFGYKAYSFVEIIVSMDKGLTEPKWVLINQPKIPQMPQNFRPNLSAQAQKFGIFEKKLSLGVRSSCL